MATIDFEKTELNPTMAHFIATFLRFEFALKEAGLGQRNGNAEVDWDRVSHGLGLDFFNDIRASGKAATLLSKPPKKQVTRDFILEWREQAPPENTKELLLAVRRVRNNLFHGGKSGDPEFDLGGPSRSTILIAEAQGVIEQALLRMEDVRVHFEGKY